MVSEKLIIILAPFPFFVGWKRLAAHRQEIFDLLFEAAEIATFTPEDKVKYEFEMTTERDIRNQIAFAKKNARAEGIIEGKAEGNAEGRMENGIESARRMLEDHLPIETIAKYSGLSVEQVQDLQNKAEVIISGMQKAPSLPQSQKIAIQAREGASSCPLD